MSIRQIYSALLSLGVLTLSFTIVLGHDDTPQSKQGQKESRPDAPDTAASSSQGTSMKSDPAAAFAILVDSVMRGKNAVEVELADLPRYPDLFQFLTKPPNGRYVVKQLILTKDDEVRALSVALHPPHDIFLTRGKEVGAAAFEGMYYVVDRTGWLQGAAVREGKTITEVPMGDVWQGYEREKAFWIWLAEQIAGSSKAGR
ncbi:MAG TPA: hypothetical protein VGL70_19405 [Candidatus Binatia bacterium]|jgi:hypothetical protein